jgi:hypothetical protein
LVVAFVQTAGQAWRLARNAACNRHHTLEQQLSRCLLLTLERGPEHELVIPRELVAKLLATGCAWQRLRDGAGHWRIAACNSRQPRQYSRCRTLPVRAQAR